MRTIQIHPKNNNSYKSAIYTISELPVSLHTKILKFLDPDDLKHCACVSHQWDQYVQEVRLQPNIQLHSSSSSPPFLLSWKHIWYICNHETLIWYIFLFILGTCACFGWMIHSINEIYQEIAFINSYDSTTGWIASNTFVSWKEKNDEIRYSQKIEYHYNFQDRLYSGFNLFTFLPFYDSNNPESDVFKSLRLAFYLGKKVTIFLDPGQHQDMTLQNYTISNNGNDTIRLYSFHNFQQNKKPPSFLLRMYRIKYYGNLAISMSLYLVFCGLLVYYLYCKQLNTHGFLSLNTRNLSINWNGKKLFPLVDCHEVTISFIFTVIVFASIPFLTLYACLAHYKTLPHGYEELTKYQGPRCYPKETSCIYRHDLTLIIIFYGLFVAIVFLFNIVCVSIIFIPFANISIWKEEHSSVLTNQTTPLWICVRPHFIMSFFTTRLLHIDAEIHYEEDWFDPRKKSRVRRIRKYKTQIYNGVIKVLHPFFFFLFRFFLVSLFIFLIYLR